MDAESRGPMDSFLNEQVPLPFILSHYSLPEAPSAGFPAAPRPTSISFSQRSLGSSLATSQCIMSNPYGYPPSLAPSGFTETNTSISTALASHLGQMPLLEDVNGVLERPLPNVGPPIYDCAFAFLGCQYVSQREDEWRTHCLSHFDNQEPPREVECPLCEEFTFKSEDGWVAWDARMAHLAALHHRLGQTLKLRRPEFALYKYLWRKRLIDDAQLKDLMSNHVIQATDVSQPITVTQGRYRDRRRERLNSRSTTHRRL